MKGTDTQEVILRYLGGDLEALNDLQPAIDGMLVSLINKYKCKCEFDDLYQICWVTVMKCLKTYKPESGILFSTFCYKAISNNLIMAENKERRHLSKYDKNGRCIRNFISKDSHFKASDDLAVESVIPSNDWDISKRVIFNEMTPIILEIAESYVGTRRSIVLSYLKGERQCEIAKKLEVTYAYVSKVIKEFISECNYEVNRR